MGVVVSMLRGINLAGHHKIGMEDLRALYESLGLKKPQSYIQSGNVVFQSREKDLRKLALTLSDAIERRYGFRADVVLRTPAELRELLNANPLAARGLEPAKSLVIFLSSPMAPEFCAGICELAMAPEEAHTDSRHVFCYYPDGMGRSKLPAAIEKHLKKLKIIGTGRNWNTVLKLLAMAEAMDAE